MTHFGEVPSDTEMTDQVIIATNNFRKGATSPADGTLGTTPTVPTLLFAATNELLSGIAVMPFNWDRTVDVDLILLWALAAGQTNGDLLDVTVDYTVPRFNTGGVGPGKVSTQVTGQITAITGQLAIGDPYQMVIPLARADANNPYTSLDAFAFALEFHLTNVTGIASAHFLGACIAHIREH
ncbi:MAG: hypothetical protein KAJ19_22205 [Gammaproteobacteria bacterium]|nr:hypothetical protein [Gammaproteobacteria bacterium]